MLLPGVMLSMALWVGVNIMFHRSGVGGALLALKAREPNQAELKELQLADVVQEMAIASGLPAPQVMLVDSPGANAAAIGTSPYDARIVVSRRLVDDLSRDELEAVLAHLIASIGNGDLHIAFRMTAVLETCGLLVAFIIRHSGRDPATFFGKFSATRYVVQLARMRRKKLPPSPSSLAAAAI